MYMLNDAQSVPELQSRLALSSLCCLVFLITCCGVTVADAAKTKDPSARFDEAIADLKVGGTAKAWRAIGDIASPEFIDSAIPAVARLIRDGSISPDRGYDALRTFAKRVNDTTAELLVELVAHDHPAVSSAAIQSMGTLSKKVKVAAVPMLTSYLQQSDTTVLQRALTGLLNLDVAFPAAATREFLRLVYHDDLNICTLAIRALAISQGEVTEIVPILTSRFDHCDTGLQAFAGISVILVGLRNPPKAIPHLLGVLECETPSVQVWSATSLYWIGKYAPAVSIPCITEGLRGGNNRVVQTAAEIMGEIGPDAKLATQALIAMLDNPIPDNKSAAINALHKIGVTSRALSDSLIPFLESENDTMRFAAARALIPICRKEPVVIGQLTDFAEGRTDTCQRLVAVIFNELGRKKAVSAIPWLLIQVKHENADNRQEAVGALAAVGSGRDEVLAALFESLRDTAEPVRSEAALALGKMESRIKEIIPHLIAMLDDPDSRALRIAVYALGEAGAPAKDAVPRLTALLDHPNDAVRGRAAESLILITKKKDPGMSVLVACLKSADPWARNIAVGGMSQIGSQAAEALPELAPMLNDPDTRVRYNTVVALGNIGKSGTLTLLGLTGPNRHANYVTSWLIHALKDKDPDVVKAAVWALRSVTGQVYDPATGQPRYVPPPSIDMSAINSIIMTNQILYGNAAGVTR